MLGNRDMRLRTKCPTPKYPRSTYESETVFAGQKSCTDIVVRTVGIPRAEMKRRVGNLSCRYRIVPLPRLNQIRSINSSATGSKLRVTKFGTLEYPNVTRYMYKYDSSIRPVYIIHDCGVLTNSGIALRKRILLGS